MQSGYLWLAFLDAQVSTIRLIGTRWAWTSNTSSRRAVYYSHNEWVRVKQAHCAALTRNVSHNDLRARSASAWRLNYTPRCYLTFFPNNSKCKVLVFFLANFDFDHTFWEDWEYFTYIMICLRWIRYTYRSADLFYKWKCHCSLVVDKFLT